MKKCLSLIIALLCCFLFVGCGQRLPSSNEFILLSVVQEDGGKTTQSLNFSLGSNKLKNAKASELDIQSVKQKLLENVKNFRDEFYLNFILIYNNNPNEDFKIGSALTISEVTYNEKADTVGFSMVFANQQVWNYYHPKTGEGNDKGDLNYGFMITSSSSGIFPFSSELDLTDKKITVGQRYMNAYLDAMANSSVKVSYSPDLVYDYGTPLSYIKSDSEYYFVDDANINHHVWLRNCKEYETNNTIKLFISQANKGLWYALALGVAVLSVVVGVITVKLIDRKQPKK